MFISFEGIDGSGKTTLAHRVAERLRGDGYSVVEVREPGGTPLGEAIRTLLLDPASDISARAEVLLFSAARSQLVDTVVRPALEQGNIVVADRFFDSTTAYQGGGRGIMSVNELDTLHAFATASLRPDLTFLVDLAPEIAAARRRAEGTDRIEASGDTFYEAVRDAYAAIASRSPDRVVVLDGAQTRDTLESLAIAAINRRRSRGAM